MDSVRLKPSRRIGRYRGARLRQFVPTRHDPLSSSRPRSAPFQRCSRHQFRLTTCTYPASSSHRAGGRRLCGGSGRKTEGSLSAVKPRRRAGGIACQASRRTSTGGTRTTTGATPAIPGRSHGDPPGGSGTAPSNLAFTDSFRRRRSSRSLRDSVVGPSFFWSLARRWLA